jgi:hypothetical protein
VVKELAAEEWVLFGQGTKQEEKGAGLDVRYFVSRRNIGKSENKKKQDDEACVVRSEVDEVRRGNAFWKKEATAKTRMKI